MKALFDLKNLMPKMLILFGVGAIGMYILGKNFFSLVFVSLFVLTVGLDIFIHRIDILNFFLLKRVRKELSFTYRIFLLMLCVIIVYGLFYFKVVSYRKDFTQAKRYTLSTKTVAALNDLSVKVQISVFDVNVLRDDLKRLLAVYDKHKRVRVNIINMAREPEKVARAKIKLPGTLVFEVLDNINEDNRLLLTQDEMEKDTLNKFNRRQTKEYYYEQMITATIIGLQEKNKKNVLFVRGHGENSTTGKGEHSIALLVDTMRRSRLQCSVVFLQKELKKPRSVILNDDIDLIIIHSPQEDFSIAELNFLQKQFNTGTSLFVLLNPNLEINGSSKSALPSLERFLATNGVIAGDDMVVDKKNYLPRIGNKKGSPFMPIVNFNDDSVVTRDLARKNFFGVLVQARSVSWKKPTDVLKSRGILQSATSSFGERKSNLKTTLKYQKSIDYKGPLWVASLTRKRLAKAKTSTGLLDADSKSEARLAFVGDGDFVSNLFVNVGANRDFYLNVINWLLHQKSNVVYSAPFTASTIQPLYLSKRETKALMWIMIIILPLITLSCGLLYRFRFNFFKTLSSKKL